MLTALAGQNGTLHRIAEPLSSCLWIDLASSTNSRRDRACHSVGTRHGTLYLSLPLVTLAANTAIEMLLADHLMNCIYDAAILKC